MTNLIYLCPECDKEVIELIYPEGYKPNCRLECKVHGEVWHAITEDWKVHETNMYLAIQGVEKEGLAKKKEILERIK